MSVGRPNSSLIITPEVYEANRAKIEAAKAALQAAEMKNEQGRKNHEQMAAELRTQIQAGEEARRALEQLEAARNYPTSQNVLGPVNPPLIEHPTYNATELATTSRIEEVPVHNSTYNSSPHTQSSWPTSISQNGHYVTNNLASYGAPSVQTYSNSHATNGFAGSGSSAGNPYIRQLNNQMYQPHVQPVTQHRRTSYGPVLQTYPTTQQQFQQYVQQATQPYTKPQQVPQARMSTHASAFSPSNHQVKQHNSQYSGDVYNYNAQQSQQHPNESQGTAAAAAIGKQRVYQPASGSSSLDGALTPVGQSVGQVNAQRNMEDGKPPETSSTQPLFGLNSEPTPAGASNGQVAPQRSMENTKQPQTSTPYPPSSSIVPSSGSSNATITFQGVSANSSQQYTNKPHAQPNTSNSHPTASNSPSTQMSKSSILASPQSLVQQARHYVMSYASRWGEMAPPNSFVNLPQLPQYKLYKGFDCRLRVGVERNERTVLISLDEFLSKELPALVAKHGIQAHNLQPGHVGTSSAATSAPSYISKVPAVPSLPTSVSASSRTPSHVTLSAQPEIPRTPAQADKKHLARDILRALKRRRPSSSNEREPKKHASVGSVLAHRTNVEDELVKHYTTTAPPSTETIVGTTILTPSNGVHISDSGIIRGQSPALSASIPISSSFQKPLVLPASVPDSVISSNGLSPHPPSPEVESNRNDNILPHDAPVTSIPKDNDIIVIEDSQPSTPGIGEIPKHKEQPQVAQRSLSPEIPVPSPVMKSQALSVLPLPSVKPSVSQVDSVNLGRELQTGKETSKLRRPIPYVLVPPPPEYVIRYKKHLARRGSTSNGAQPGLSSRTKSKGSFNGGTDYQVEDLPPFTYDGKEREAVQISCTRLRETACNWTGCYIVLNSVQGLIVHLKNDHKPPTSTHTPFTCFWKNCGGYRGIDGRICLGHVERHALHPLYCAYEDCDESFRLPGQLVKHNDMWHKNSTLKPAADLKPITPLKTLPPCPGIIPSTMIETVVIRQPSISQARHAALTPLVLKNISGPVHLKTERHSSRKPLRPSKYGRNEEEDGGDNYEFLITGASKKHYSSVLSSPAKIHGEIIKKNYSEDVTQMAHDGLVIWSPPVKEEEPLPAPLSTLVSGFSGLPLESDDADEEVRPEEFDDLELKRWVSLPELPSTSRAGSADNSEEVVESMLAPE